MIPDCLFCVFLLLLTVIGGVLYALLAELFSRQSFTSRSPDSPPSRHPGSRPEVEQP